MSTVFNWQLYFTIYIKHKNINLDNNHILKLRFIMFLDMQGEMIGPCKGPLTHPAGVRPHPRVLPHVPPQLVRP